jgi:enterochelin esterase family protein
MIVNADGESNMQVRILPKVAQVSTAGQRARQICGAGRRLGNLIVALLCCGAAAQGMARAQRPEVHPDLRVTFRFRAPNAKEVFLVREGAARLPMQKDGQGVWSVTTDPLEPDLYGYSFVADGVGLMDPTNPLIKPNLLGPQSVVYVPGPATLPWEITPVPHGAIDHHFYRSTVIGDERDFYVYTPPGYDPRAGKRYPVLYLLHGYSDDASGWTAVGRAHIILDNLIAQGKAKPMVVVMPLGYGAPEIVMGNGSGRRDPGIGQRNFDKFTQALISEVIPEVEKSYRVIKDRNARAITGLSMGGGESLTTGLNHLDTFAWIGSFSGAVIMAGNDYPKLFPTLDSRSGSRIRLLWIACGTDDGLLAPNRKFEEWLKSKGTPFTQIETPGAHTWMVWRRNLANFVPLLFQEKSSSARL